MNCKNCNKRILWHNQTELDTCLRALSKPEDTNANRRWCVVCRKEYCGGDPEDNGLCIVCQHAAEEPEPYETEVRKNNKPYRPSNGSEGAAFTSLFCERCEQEREFREEAEDW